MADIKCVVTDLDGTLWDGTLLENGIDKLRLDQEYVNSLRQLDQRGILLAIASKNNEADALEALNVLGRRLPDLAEPLEELFVAKQIHWGPKSRSLETIAQELNISLDSLALVDDRSFELEEVRFHHPEVTLVPKNEYAGWFSRAEFAGANTWEARNRRMLYNAQHRRASFKEQFTGTDMEFLRSLEMKATVKLADDADLDRVTELIQRSHQLNFSNNTYTRGGIQAIHDDSRKDIYVVNVADKLGDYGAVGVAIVDKATNDWLVQDLLFSCRIQGKGVESATIAYLFGKAKQAGAEQLCGTYKRTDKNSHLPATYESLEFSARQEGNLVYYSKRTNEPIPSIDHIVMTETDISEPHKGIPFIRKFMEQYLQSNFPSGFPPGFRVLDVGAGWGEVLGEDWVQWVKSNYGQVDYVRLDQRQYGSYIDVLADAETMSNDPRIGKHNFDMVLSFECLEHTPHPWRIVEQMGLVAKQGATIIASAPYNQPPHYEPHDYSRFTPDEMKQLFGSYRILATEIEGRADKPRRTLIVAKP